MCIYFLTEDAYANAKSYFNGHIRTMLPIYTQILSNVYYASKVTRDTLLAPFKRSSANAGAVEWAESSLLNWYWLLVLCLGICNEYEKMYGHKHSCEEILHKMSRKPPHIVDNKFVLPHGHVDLAGLVEESRQQYFEKKSSMCDYTGREIPLWVLYLLEATAA